MGSSRSRPSSARSDEGVCGRYTSTSRVEELIEAFEVDEVRLTESLPSRWNVAPSLPVYAVASQRSERTGGELRRLLGTFRWGLVPSWATDPAIGSRMINARADTVSTKGAFRTAFSRRRCIIPADAFYEWQVTGPGASGRPRPKIPWAVRRRDGQPMAFAGLWEVWRDPEAAGGDDPDAGRLRTCAVITTDANRVVAPIRDRMPVILPSGVWDEWLDPASADLDALEALLVPAPDEVLEAFIVSSRVNSVTNEGPELLDPAPPPGDGDPGAQGALFDKASPEQRVPLI